MCKLINQFRHDEEGPAMVEYGLLVGVIALVVVSAAAIVGQDISTLFSKVATHLSTITP